MPGPTENFEDDWIHGVFEVFREEAISVAADFGGRVKREIDLVADTADLRPPSATSLLTSVAIESSNIAISPFTEPPQDEEPPPEADETSDEDPERGDD